MQEVYHGYPFLKDILNVASPFINAFRWIGYQLLCMIAHILDMCGQAIDTILGINFMNAPGVNEFINSVSPVAWPVLTISLTAAGIYLMFWGKGKETFRNLLFAVILIVAVPFIFSTLGQFQTAGVADMQTQISGDSSKPGLNNIGQQMLREYIVDIANTQQQWAKSKGQTQYLSSDIDPYTLDINAYLPDQDPWKYKIDYAKPNGTLMGEPLGSGFFGWGADRLYAYGFTGVSFTLSLICMLIMIIALGLAGFKMARTMFDIIFHHVIASIVFASDINGSGRSKKVLNSLISLYIMLVLILVVLKIFIDTSSYVISGSWNILVKVLLLGGMAWGCIDGPDVIIKLIGVDTGVRGGAGVLLGVQAAGNMTANVGGAAVGAAKGIGKGVAGAATGAVTGTAGAIGAMKTIPHIKDNIKAGAAEAQNGHFKNTIDYGKKLAENDQDKKWVAGGEANATNAQKTLGYFGQRVKSKLSHEKSSTGEAGGSLRQAFQESKDNTSPPPVDVATANSVPDTSEPPLADMNTSVPDQTTLPEEHVTGADSPPSSTDTSDYSIDESDRAFMEQGSGSVSAPSDAGTGSNSSISAEPAASMPHPTAESGPVAQTNPHITHSETSHSSADIPQSNRTKPAASATSYADSNNYSSAASASNAIPHTNAGNVDTYSPNKNYEYGREAFTETPVVTQTTASNQNPPTTTVNINTNVASENQSIPHGWKEATNSVEKPQTQQKTFWPSRKRKEENDPWA